MLVGALFFDLLSIVPVVNWFSNIAYQLLYFIIFSIKGVFYFKNKKIIGVTLVCAVLEFIPLASILPANTFQTWRIITASRIEDRAQNS